MNFRKSDRGIIPEIQADEAKVKYVVWELLTNALKYSEKGEITVEAVPLKDYVLLSVADSGAGINPEAVDSILKEEFIKGDFFHKTQEGLGLGLFTVKRIVDLHKGKVEISSKPGSGTTVKVYLPR